MVGIRQGSPSRYPLSALWEVDWDRQLSDPSHDTTALSFFSGFGLGTVIGCIVAVLLAPQSGRDVREHVRYTGIQLRSRATKRGPHSNDSIPGTLTDEAEQAEVDLLRRIAGVE